VVSVLGHIGDALGMAGAMTWEILWALILGFGLSAIVQAVVRRESVYRLLGDDRPKTLAIASGLGAASSSCSYAAVALARALVRRGASFTAAMAFEIASTNLVIELGIIMALLLGWQFTASRFIGGPIMIVLVAVIVPPRLAGTAAARCHRASRTGRGRVDGGHAAMDMSVRKPGGFWARLASGEGSPRCRTSSSWNGRQSFVTWSADCCWPGRSPPGYRTPSGSSCSSPATPPPKRSSDRSSGRWCRW